MNQALTQQEIAAEARAEKYRIQAELMRQLYLPAGFFAYFFEELKNPEHKTRVDCFNKVNDLHEELFGVRKYSCYASFQVQLKRHLR